MIKRDQYEDFNNLIGNFVKNYKNTENQNQYITYFHYVHNERIIILVTRESTDGAKMECELTRESTVDKFKLHECMRINSV